MNNCNLTNHQYGLWQIENENEVSRTCNNCGFKQKYPTDIDTLKEIKKQEEAKPLLTSFLKISNDDINLIGSIYVILEDVVNFIDNQNKILLINKLTELKLTAPLTEENKISLDKFITSIKENDTDLLYDTIDFFKKHNEDVLSSPPLAPQPNFSK